MKRNPRPPEWLVAKSINGLYNSPDGKTNLVETFETNRAPFGISIRLEWLTRLLLFILLIVCGLYAFFVGSAVNPDRVASPRRSELPDRESMCR
jgi:hypothetical protein